MILYQNTSKGRRVVDMGVRYDGVHLNQCYNKWSQAKENAWNYCYNKYLATPRHDCFSICSHNSFGFTCSWLGEYEGQDAMYVETRDNSYIVILVD